MEALELSKKLGGLLNFFFYFINRLLTELQECNYKLICMFLVKNSIILALSIYRLMISFSGPKNLGSIQIFFFNGAAFSIATNERLVLTSMLDYEASVP